MLLDAAGVGSVASMSRLAVKKGSTDNLRSGVSWRELFHHRAGHAQRAFTHK
jgi:hypothetical protein